MRIFLFELSLLVLSGLWLDHATSFSVSRLSISHHHRHASSSRVAAPLFAELYDDDDDEEAEEMSSPSAANVTATTNATSPAEASSPPPNDKEKDTKGTPTMEENLSFLQTLGSITGRGEFATAVQKNAAAKAVAALEAGRVSSSQGTAAIDTSLLPGTWELVYCSTQLFRSSPFFMAARAVCTTDDSARQFNWFCDMHRQALAISTIRSVRQIVSDTRLVSELEVSAGAVPFLRDFTCLSYSGGWPVTIDGALVSSADITEIGDGALEVYMDTVQVKGSNVPGLRQMLDAGLKLQSRQLADVLERTVSGYTTPKPIFRTTYLEDKFRVSRDEDDHIFVYVKTSDSTEPTDYSAMDADLGVLKLLQGFNDAVTKVYL